MGLLRRDFCAGLGASLLAAPLVGQAAPASAPTRLRLLLNAPLSGPHAFFAVAQQQGYFAQAGLEVEFVEGDGAASVVPRIAQEGLDGGYGDLNALIKLAAQRPRGAPVAVHATFNTTPLTIGVRHDGPIRKPADLQGHVIGGHPIDAALETFPAYALAAGVDESRVSVLRSTASMSLQARDVIDGHVDGLFGFVHTIIASLAEIGIDGRRQMRFLEYREVVPEFYGNSLMLSRALIRDQPDAVRGLVAAINRGLVETMADPESALEHLLRMAPKARREIDGPRLRGTLAVEMAGPGGSRIALGDVDDARLQRSIELMVQACRLPRKPAATEIFDRGFLPPPALRAGAPIGS